MSRLVFLILLILVLIPTVKAQHDEKFVDYLHEIIYDSCNSQKSDIRITKQVVWEENKTPVKQISYPYSKRDIWLIGDVINTLIEEEPYSSDKGKNAIKCGNYSLDIYSYNYYWNGERVEELIKIIESWNTYKEDNKGVLNKYETLIKKKGRVDNKVWLARYNSYEDFLDELRNFNNSITHYKQIPSMLMRIEIFVDSDLAKYYCTDCHKIGYIRSYFRDKTHNESYLKSDLERDIKDITPVIHVKEVKRPHYLVIIRIILTIVDIWDFITFILSTIFVIFFIRKLKGRKDKRAYLKKHIRETFLGKQK